MQLTLYAPQRAVAGRRNTRFMTVQSTDRKTRESKKSWGLQ
jgi:hypothetical protein